MRSRQVVFASGRQLQELRSRSITWGSSIGIAAFHSVCPRFDVLPGRVGQGWYLVDSTVAAQTPSTPTTSSGAPSRNQEPQPGAWSCKDITTKKAPNHGFSQASFASTIAPQPHCYERWAVRSSVESG